MPRTTAGNEMVDFSSPNTLKYTDVYVKYGTFSGSMSQAPFLPDPTL